MGKIESTLQCSLRRISFIVGDSLYFYVSGRYNSKPKHDSNFATGVAVLRRDDFVSMYVGSYLFVNVDVKKHKSL